MEVPSMNQSAAQNVYVAYDIDSTPNNKIDGVKFRKKVVPGDTLLFRVELVSPLRRGIATMKGYIFVGESIVCEATFTAQIIQNK